MTSLNLLVFVFAALAAVGLLSLASMFLAENPRMKKGAFYIAVALSLYACSISYRIFWPEFMLQTVIGMVLGALSILALIVDFAGSKSRTQFLATRAMAAVAMVSGIVNAFS